MRIKSKTLIAALLAIVSLVLGAPPARAVLTVVDGDVLLGFRITGAPQDALVINLGQYTQFTNAAPGATLSFGSLSSYGQDLTDKFGASWSTRSDLLFGAIGAYSGSGVSIYASRARSVSGTPATAFASLSQTNRNNTQAAVNTVNAGFVNTGTTTASTNTVNAGFQTGTASGRYYFAVNPALDFTTLASIEGSFTGTKVLDFFALSSSPTARLGTFTINDSTGAVTFAAVPEPSTYMLFALAGVVFMTFVRRRRALQQ